MALKIIRPKLSAEKLEEIQSYVLEQWRRAEEARMGQVGTNFPEWENAYRGIPREKIRTIPWYKSSNVVVQLIRLFVDTFVARTQGIIMSTRPLYSVDQYPREQRDAVELYLHKKAVNHWKHLQLLGQLLPRGTKQGTAIVKVAWVEDTTIDVTSAAESREVDTSDWQEVPVVRFRGPLARCVSFDDFAVYPITANDMSEVDIKFHRVRYTREQAMKRIRSGVWLEMTEEEINAACEDQTSGKRREEQENAGVSDAHLEHLHMVEVYFEWPVTNDDSKYYSIVAVICPKANRMVDLYFNPNPANYENFYMYRPSPREDFFYGESWCEILASAQEEVSTIHNDRRNSAFLASAPVFKRRAGAGIPNPSTTWYPGKVFDVEDMTDFDVISVGRNVGDLLAEEMQVLNIAERVMGIGAMMQGMAAGSTDKRGVYNTGGVLGVISEGNQRQDTNISDVREVMGEIAKASFFLQSHFDPNDAFIDIFPPEIGNNIREALRTVSLTQIAGSRFAIKASNAGSNKEMEKASLLQMSNVLAQYSQTLQQLGPMYMNMPESPVKTMTYQILEMAGWMVKRLLKAFDEYDAEGVVPDVRQLFGPSGAGGLAPTGPVQPVSPDEMELGGTGGAGGALTRQTLQSLDQMVGGVLGNAGI
jgi:hypothetical protein